MQSDNQSRIHFTQHNQPPARPHLAPNVVCMFDEERPPVQQTRTRGRYPRCVARLASRPRLVPGDIAEMTSEGWSGRVMILRENYSPNLGNCLQFQVMGVDGPIKGKGKRYSVVTVVAHRLRLIKCGGSSERARAEREAAWFDECKLQEKGERIARIIAEAIRNARPDPLKN